MKVAVLGGTKGMGRALARALAERGDAVCLLGRDAEDLRRSAQDLEIRASREGATGVQLQNADVTPMAIAACDLEDPTTFEPALTEAEKQLGGLDTVVVTAGMFGTQDALEADTAQAHRLLTVNFANTVTFCEYARKRLLARGGGTLCVFSSVAGERGRKPVVLYGASKAGLSRYLEGLDHRYRAQGLKVVCVKPGFVKTGMTEGLKPPPFAGEPQQVANQVVRAIDRGRPVVYTPGIWAFIMLIIRTLPRFVMRRIGF